MKTCKTCAFWKSRGVTPGPGVVFEYGLCKRIADADTHPVDCRDAICVDYEGYSAWVETGPDFGCTLWEKAE